MRRPAPEGVSIELSEFGRVHARTLLLATGANYRRLGVPRLEALNGTGVYYGGSSSEAPAMAGRDVYVLGGANSAGQAMIGLIRRPVGSPPRCSEINRDSSGTGADVELSPAWTLARSPHLLETSMPGVCAVGDVRHGSGRRVAAAVGEGAVAIQLLHQLFAAERHQPRGRPRQLSDVGSGL